MTTRPYYAWPRVNKFSDPRNYG